ncbi:3-hydroxyacyl-CoA dehydrogenase NAD-binding domain-containing protein [Amylibacter sp.]|nr:3-hydroxyacyl-CoA dehydrogenase NAD-binding domain-containing protein [Amylibacter sp.]
MADFHYEINDGVAVISWNTPTRNMNIMDLQSLSDLEIKIDKALSDNDVIGVIITSGKSNFSGGLDLGCISKIPGIISENFQENLFKGLKVFTNLTRKIELAGMNNKNTDGKPIVCTLDGDALGVGFEIALSCHKIFVSDNPIGKLGFPDILIGMPPLAGSISRLIRKIDKDLCASLLQNGEYINFENAIKHGLVDEMKSSDDLIPFAMQWIKSNLKKNIIKPWDMERYSSEEKILKKFSSLEDEIKQANKKSSLKGIHSSFGAMFEDLYKNKDINFDKALWAELNWLVNILTHSTQNSMVKTLHVHKPALEKGASRPSGVEYVPIKKVGILGAGMMGAGIAFVSAKVGVDVVLLDQNQEVVDRGLLSVKRMLDQGLKRNKFSAEDAKNIFERILPTVKYEDLNGCDLIIEAVFEDPKIKSLVTKSAEAEVSEDVIFATNTSTLPISELAKASCDQSKYIGIHFFSPVHLMNLVEIIKGKKTGNKAVAVALDFVKQIKKTPIVVNDERYFYANRCILPYINEGIRMLDEGLDPGLIDDAAKLMGMPVGPLQLADEISIELCFKIMTATRAAMGDSYPYSAADTIVEKMCGEGRMGRKNLKGFYVYDENGKRSGFWKGLSAQWPVSSNQPDITEVKCRLAMTQTLEALRALEEGVLEDIREGDVGAVLGWGFQPWSGGPFGWVDMIGTERAINICENLTEKYGSRFIAPKLLYNLDMLGEGFYK